MHKKFLEEYPLYKHSTGLKVSLYVSGLNKVAINMPCTVCKSSQTFVMTNEYTELGRNQPTSTTVGKIFRLFYVCSHCRKFVRQFFV